MVHMPGHLYYRLGRYRDALEANRAAIAADEAYLKETGAKGIYAQGYYPHNVHFLLVSAQMAGDGETALAAAEKLVGVISDEAVRTVLGPGIMYSANTVVVGLARVQSNWGGSA